MRGADRHQREMLFDFSIESRIALDHPLRMIRLVVDEGAAFDERGTDDDVLAHGASVDVPRQ